MKRCNRFFKQTIMNPHNLSETVSAMESRVNGKAIHISNGDIPNPERWDYSLWADMVQAAGKYFDDFGKGQKIIIHFESGLNVTFEF